MEGRKRLRESAITVNIKLVLPAVPVAFTTIMCTFSIDRHLKDNPQQTALSAAKGLHAVQHHVLEHNVCSVAAAGKSLRGYTGPKLCRSGVSVCDNIIG